MEHVGRDEKVVVHACYGVFHHFLAFAGAEEDSDRRIVAFVHFVFLIVRHVGVELAKIFMAELVVLQLHNDATMKDAIVEHQVGKEVLVVDNHALLSVLKAEALTQFQQKVLQMGDKGIFKITFRHLIATFALP